MIPGYRRPRADARVPFGNVSRFLTDAEVVRKAGQAGAWRTQEPALPLHGAGGRANPLDLAPARKHVGSSPLQKQKHRETRNMPRTASNSNRSWQDEVFYQVYSRSFFDSNGDGVGDLRGLESRLDYLADLGVTALWLNPLFVSPTEHKYFPTDFFRVDPEYGTNEDFFHLCDAIHDRGMKILLDMETQYVPRTHEWAADVIGNPRSPRRHLFLPKKGKGHGFEHLSLDMGGGMFHVPDILVLNLDNPEVRAYQKSIFRYWMHPRGKGRLRGVDGFRMDHVMDDLDGKGRLTGMLADFWKELVDDTRTIRPDAFFLAEPADWKAHGEDIMEQSGMDAVFAIRLMFAIAALDAGRIRTELDAIRSKTPSGHLFSVVAENHDVTRFASMVRSHPGKLRLGALLTLALDGLPCLYYGQEIGMKGKTRPDRFAHIPLREGMRWHHTVEGDGMCHWHRTAPAFGVPTCFRDGDGISVEDQRSDPESLLNLYRRLVWLRRERPCLRRGSLRWLETDDPNVLAWERELPAKDRPDSLCFVANLSSRRRAVRVPWGGGGAEPIAVPGSSSTDNSIRRDAETLHLTLGAWDFAILER